jgi:hypothetical protein
VLPPFQSDDAERRRKLLQEARASAAFRGPRLLDRRVIIVRDRRWQATEGRRARRSTSIAMERLEGLSAGAARA